MKLCEVLETTPDEILLGATTELDSSDYAKHVASRMQKLSNDQKKLVINFIDMIAETESKPKINK